ncbi:MAG: hypothetical protein R2827_16395 [Bdellovibrionales bacterium]
MSTQVNWNRIKKELGNVKDLDSLKRELEKLAREIQKFDINDYLSPTAKKG